MGLLQCYENYGLGAFNSRETLAVANKMEEWNVAIELLRESLVPR